MTHASSAQAIKVKTTTLIFKNNKKIYKRTKNKMDNSSMTARITMEEVEKIRTVLNWNIL